MFCGLILILISEILFVIFSNYSLPVMWAANILYGVGVGPLHASSYHLIEDITPVTATMGVFISFMVGIIEIIVPVILGALMESNPFALIYLNFVLLFFSFIVILIIYLLTKNHMTIQINKSKIITPLDNLSTID